MDKSKYWDVVSFGNGDFLISWQLQQRRDLARGNGSTFFRSAILRRGKGEDAEGAEALWDGDVGVGWVIDGDRDETVVADSLDGVLAEAFSGGLWPDVDCGEP